MSNTKWIVVIWILIRYLQNITWNFIFEFIYRVDNKSPDILTKFEERQRIMLTWNQ